MQKVLSGDLAARNFLVRPPEPAPSLLLSSPSESVYMGKSELLHVPFFWNPKKLINPHLCVVGITGSGKSYFVKTFITRASLTFGASALILDWAGEYADWVRQAGGRVLSFGEQGLNLLDLGGATPHARTRQVIEALEILTDLPSFPRQRRLTEEAIEQAYLSAGFKLHQEQHSARKKLPTLEEVHAQLAKKSRADPEAAEAARRIKGLLLSSGKSFSSTTMRLEQLLSGLVCVDLHSLPMESLRSLAGLAILQFVKEKMRQQEYKSGGAPKLFVVVDEAWKIASDGRSDVVSIVREGRKYGFGLVVASQNPTDVHKSIFSNAGTVLCFRLTLASERDYVRSSLSYSEYFERRSHSLGVGQALVHIEPSEPLACPRSFVLSRVDGEQPLAVAKIRGGGMELEFEKGELAKKLLSFGLPDSQVQAILSEFERRSYSLEASQFLQALSKLGHGRAQAVSLLRELGAEEKDLLQLFSSIGGDEEILLSLQEPAPEKKAAAGQKRKTARQKTPARQKSTGGQKSTAAKQKRKAGWQKGTAARRKTITRQKSAAGARKKTGGQKRAAGTRQKTAAGQKKEARLKNAAAKHGRIAKRGRKHGR